MRGKVKGGEAVTQICGITPAYAGKSFSVEAATSENRDHPRLCGEKFFTASTPCVSAGSPPPMRGKVSRSSFNMSFSRITPAYAGKRSHISSSLSQSKDHPRLCGEKNQRRLGYGSTIGSPPPMRGKGVELETILK